MLGILAAFIIGVAFIGVLNWIVLRIVLNGVPLNVSDETPKSELDWSWLKAKPVVRRVK